MPLPSDLQPISLDHRLVSSPGLPISSGMTNQSVPRDPNSAYSQNYMPLFAVQVASPSPQPLPLSAIPPPLSCSGVSSETASLLPGGGDGDVPSLSVITHTASSVVTPSNAATTFCQGADLTSSAPLPPNSLSQSLQQPSAPRLPVQAVPPPPPPPQALPQTLPQPLAPSLTSGLQQPPLQAAPLPPLGPSVQPQPQPQAQGVALSPAFIQPRPVGSFSRRKGQQAQRIAPASARPSTQLIITGESCCVAVCGQV